METKYFETIENMIFGAVAPDDFVRSDLVFSDIVITNLHWETYSFPGEESHGFQGGMDGGSVVDNRV